MGHIQSEIKKARKRIEDHFSRVIYADESSRGVAYVVAGKDVKQVRLDVWANGSVKAEGSNIAEAKTKAECIRSTAGAIAVIRRPLESYEETGSGQRPEFWASIRIGVAA